MPPLGACARRDPTEKGLVLNGEFPGNFSSTPSGIDLPMHSLGLKLEGKPSSSSSPHDILSTNIVGWNRGSLFSLGTSLT